MKRLLPPLMKKKWPLIPSWTVVWVVLGVVFFLRAFTVMDPDFGWHLASGQYILAHGVPAHDIFTYTAQHFAWIDHEWLGDVVLASLFHLGGYLLLALMYAGLWVGSLALLTRQMRGTQWVVLLASLALLPFSGVRALTWSVVMMTLLITVVNQRRVSVWWSLPLMTLWANLHGGFVLGLAYLGWYALSRWSWRLGLVMLGSALVTLLNPYGINVYQEIFRTLLDNSLHTRIEEWQSFYLSAATALFVGLWCGLWLYDSRAQWRERVVQSALLVAAVSSARNAIFFVLVSLPTVVASTHQVVHHQLGNRQFRQHLMSLMPLLVVGTGLMVSASFVTAFQSAHIDAEAAYPRQIARRLEDEPCAGRVFNDYNIGGYLIWRAPHTPVFIDGRMPSWRLDGVSFMDTYLGVIASSQRQQAVFARYDITCVVFWSHSDFVDRLKKEGWHVDVADPSGYTLLRR